MRTLAKGSTKQECLKRVDQLKKRGWTPLHDPKSIIEPNSLKWVVTLEKPDVPHNPDNKNKRIEI